jgi:hypothetical protein
MRGVGKQGQASREEPAYHLRHERGSGDDQRKQELAARTSTGNGFPLMNMIVGMMVMVSGMSVFSVSFH